MGSIPMTFRHSLSMGRKRRQFRVVKEVRAIARERLGTPPPARSFPDARKRKAPKHKKDPLLQLEE